MQRSVTLSSAEAEFFGAMLAAKEVIFIREPWIFHRRRQHHQLRQQIRHRHGLRSCCLQEDQAHLARRRVLRDLVNRGVISVEHLPGVVMLADLLTKAASRAIFTGLIKQLDDFHAL